MSTFAPTPGPPGPGGLGASPNVAGACTSLDLVRCAGEEEVAKAAGELVLTSLRSAIERRGRAVWIPSTGRTVMGCYAFLVEHHRLALDWARVEVFQMDELADVPKDQTARHFPMHRLIEPLGIRRHMLMRDASSATAEGLERALVAAVPDLVLHGIGENGHLGLNEPGTSFDSSGRAVTLNEETRRAVGAPGVWGRPPTYPVSRGSTLGLGALFAVPRSILVATGARKRRALHAALFLPATPRLPASGLQLYSTTTVIADSAAFPD